jgi:DoxX-like family
MEIMKFNKTLWTVQGALAGLFLFAGTMKLILPIEAMTSQIALPGPFLRFLGVVEMLGAVGLILPWLLKIRPVLTPLAAAGLVVITTGATAITTASAGAAPAVMPLVVGILAASVAYGRFRQVGSISRNPRLARLSGHAHSGVPAVF